jgi:hypothetical protein
MGTSQLGGYIIEIASSEFQEGVLQWGRNLAKKHRVNWMVHIPLELCLKSLRFWKFSHWL